MLKAFVQCHGAEEEEACGFELTTFLLVTAMLITSDKSNFTVARQFGITK